MIRSIRQRRFEVAGRRCTGAVCAGLALVTLSACINLDVNVPDNLLGIGGGSFVISGQAGVSSGSQSCPVWIGDNGVTYHLFQDPRVSNEAFDAITTPGTRSRLELAIRDDLELTCRVGQTVEVENVLEIGG